MSKQGCLSWAFTREEVLQALLELKRKEGKAPDYFNGDFELHVSRNGSAVLDYYPKA
jgi:hypothetical protein